MDEYKTRSLTYPPVDIVVAACNNWGIGLKNELPWRRKLVGDMQFFKMLTTQVELEGKQNVVIMGRKTFESIPERFRPLAGRINIVLSRTQRDWMSNVIHADSFQAALDIVITSLHNSVETVFVIGGADVYKLAIASGTVRRIYMTRVYADLVCDTFFPVPVNHLVEYKRVRCQGISSALHKDNDITYQFQVYEISRHCKKPHSMIAAMCENRGIGKELGLPWPHLPTDSKYYLNITSHVEQPGNRVANIKGRLTYESSQTKELSRPTVMNIVISSENRVELSHVDARVSSFEAAVNIADSSADVESVWVMGGASVYQAALHDPSFSSLLLTIVKGDFPCDTFFPEFDDLFNQENDSNTMHENGVSYNFVTFNRRNLEEAFSQT